MNARSSSLDDIFFAAREVTNAEDRAAYLDRACGGDEELRRRVERLLDALSKVGNFLEAPPPAPTVSVNGEAPTEGSGTVIGPYKLLEPIGEGGMGVVYMAEQVQPIRRKVALKIIKPGMDTKQVIARFEAERQALALMDHPNIARVLDAGATDSGRPYFVMELVRGIPVTEYCDREQLSIPDRLALFGTVCQAVQHAHQKGIIHRDIKPSNVLVTLHDGVPVPKVIDFGIAKATGQSLTDKTLYTGFAQFVGTPLYMSPEQAEMSGLDVDTRTDIYSLGVLLYELLTGTTPFDQETLRKAAWDEVRRIIREEEPPRPSTRLSTLGPASTTVSANRRTDPRRLGKLIHGELDWIVMKSLEKDRRRRYETAKALVADIECYLKHEPIEAGPPSSWYRLKKYGRRNRAALATAAVVAAALVAGTSISTWEAFRAMKAEALASGRLGEVTLERNKADLAYQEANRRATESREVVEFLINDLIGAASPSRAQGNVPTVDQVLTEADQNIARRFGDRPLIEASIRHALGQAYEELGQYRKAEEHAARAVKIRLDQLGPEHAETIAAQNALALAMLREHENPYMQDNRDKAETARVLLTSVLQTAHRVLGTEHEETLQAMHGLAVALSHLEIGDEARALQEQLLAIRKRLLGREHPKTLAAMHGLANIWMRIGNKAQAKLLYDELLPIELRNQPNHPGTLVTMENLATISDPYAIKSTDDGIDLRRRLMDRCLRVLGLAHPFTQNVIRSYALRGLNSRLRRDEVRTTLEQLLNRSRRELGRDSDASLSLTGWLAEIHAMLGQSEIAVALVDGLTESRAAIAVREELAGLLFWHVNRDAGLVQFQRAEALRTRLVSPDDPYGLLVRTHLALVLRDRGRLPEARALLEQTLSEALRLRAKVTKYDYTIEQSRGISQSLLGRWPGLAPGIGPEARPAASFAIEAPFRDVSPIADGRISPSEYGHAVEGKFSGDTNPGRLFLGYKSRSKSPDDLSVLVHAAYTDRSLFLAFRVRDQFIDAGDVDAAIPFDNDGVEIFINGDQVANDIIPPLPWLNTMGNREGFQLVADAGGHQFSMADGITNADWKVRTSRVSDGYIVEFEIPLSLIDTRDGPEYVPAASGSELLVNFGINDIDGDLGSQGDRSDYAIFWAEDPAVSPLLGGEDFWTVTLRLVPKPAVP